jgi:hypothetical protein
VEEYTFEDICRDLKLDWYTLILTPSFCRVQWRGLLASALCSAFFPVARTLLGRENEPAWIATSFSLVMFIAMWCLVAQCYSGKMCRHMLILYQFKNDLADRDYSSEAIRSEIQMEFFSWTRVKRFQLYLIKTPKDIWS